MKNKRNERDEALKAEFIAKKGITKCKTARDLAPVIVTESEEPPKLKTFTPISTDPGKKPKLLWVGVEELHVNTDYQRNISSNRGQTIIKGIVEHFKWHHFQPIMITNRELGGYWIIDGQHRTAAAQQRGIDKVPAVLMEDLSAEDQARAFAGINGKRVNVTPMAMHYALIAARDPERVALQKCCEEAGVVIPRYPKAVNYGLKPNETLTIGTLLSIMKRYGSETLIKILRSIRQTYPDLPGMINRDNIKMRIDRFKPKARSYDE